MIFSGFLRLWFLAKSWLAEPIGFLLRQHTTGGLRARKPVHARWRGTKLRYPPALLIHSRYASACLSTTCCLRSLRNDRRFSTRSLSLANSLQKRKPDREIVAHTHTDEATYADKSISTSRCTPTERQADRQMPRKQCLNCWVSPAADVFVRGRPPPRKANETSLPNFSPFPSLLSPNSSSPLWPTREYGACRNFPSVNRGKGPGADDFWAQICEPRKTRV